MLPVLYSFRRCPYAMRARLALAVSEQPCELREVVLRSKPAELLQASPKGTVPVLVLPGGQVIEQSLDIMLWALERRDPAAWLAPQKGNVDDMLELIAACDTEFKANLDRYKYPQRYDNVDALFHRQQCAAWLERLEQWLDERGGALFGEKPSLADAAIMPFVRQFSQVDRAWFDAQPWPNLQSWLAEWLHSPLFATVMVRHEPWQGGQGPTFP